MKICVISDSHGFLPSIEPCDMLLICGDISPLRIQYNIPQCEEWLKITFANWVNSLPCDKVIFVAGNHDKVFENRNYEWINSVITKPTDNKAIYLENSHVDYLSTDGKVYRIWGTPDCHIFGNWAFMYSDNTLAQHYSLMPENCDILLSHDAPYGVSDVLLQKDCPWATGEHIGNKPLADIIKKTNPSYVFHGHLHSTSHKIELLGVSKVVNCSILDEYYNITYPPLIINV